MICLRCGYCCINLSVIIINPIYIQKDLDLDNLPDDAFIHKPDGILCPYLNFTGKKAICSIHDYDWFKSTPCYNHTQIESSTDCNCRTGQYIIENNIDVLKFVHNNTPSITLN